MISIEELRKNIEDIGYFATDELIYDTFNALCMFYENEINPGQDIYALCLEGPPGAGKTEFAKTYTKLVNKLFKGNVEFVEYQCDATTGKTELFEDINISAAIRRDADNVNIPGKLIDAIVKVNQGKKVILFIDEYDKAREETDAFLLQFLQSGKINSTQHGDLEIKDEYKSNLHVILCKNDMREELSGPLSRRIRIIRLDYMEPEIFYKVAHLNLIEKRRNPINDGLLNLVSLMYEHAYNQRDLYNRLPSCSEMMIAIEDADRLMKMANAPQHIIYNTIIRNMFKSLDDITTFESDVDHLKNQKDSTLSALIKSMKSVKSSDEDAQTLNEMIATNVFKDESEKLVQKVKEMDELIDKYKIKFKDMEEARTKTIEDEYQKIKLASGKMIPSSQPSSTKLFEDESIYIKRGYNIFDTSESDWAKIGSVEFFYLSQSFFVETLIKYADKLNITIYENGFLVKNDEDCKLIVTTEINPSNGKLIFNFLCSCPFVPSIYFKEIWSFIDFATQVILDQPKTVSKITDDFSGVSDYLYNFSTLVYDNNTSNMFDEYEQVEPNIYNVLINGNSFNNQLKELNDNLDVNNVADAVTSWKKKVSGGQRKRK